MSDKKTSLNFHGPHPPKDNGGEYTVYPIIDRRIVRYRTAKGVCHMVVEPPRSIFDQNDPFYSRNSMPVEVRVSNFRLRQTNARPEALDAATPEGL